MNDNLKKLLQIYSENPSNIQYNIDLAKEYFSLGQYAAACSFLNRIIETSKDDDVVYESLILLSRVFSQQGSRDTHTFVSLYHALSLCPDRPEAYYWLCMGLEIREPFQCYAYANVGIKNWKNYKNVTGLQIEFEKYQLIFQKAVNAWHSWRIEESKELLYDLHLNYDMSEWYSELVINNLNDCGWPEKKQKLDRPSIKPLLENLEGSSTPIIRTTAQTPIVDEENKPTFVVVDNFLENPDEMRQMALNIPSEEFVKRGSVGVRSKPNPYGEIYRPIFEKLLGIETIAEEWGGDAGTHGCFQWSPASTGQVVHCDDTDWAGIIFLTPDAPPRTGTWLMKHKDTGKTHREEGLHDCFIGNEAQWDVHPFEKIDDIGNVYNRLILWNGRHLHTAGSYFGESIDNSRLYQVFFFNEKK
tara:strand:- start:719 stop:1963 length:1245 start_codon:yes stop_codon:yes gene_type:complete